MQRSSSRLRHRNENGGQHIQGNSRRSSRPLGDISNRNKIHVGKNSARSKSRTESNSKTIHLDDSSVAKSKPRRTSARLQELRQKDNVEDNARRHSYKGNKVSSNENQANSIHNGTNRNNKRRRSSNESHKRKKVRRASSPIILNEFVREDEDQYIVHPDFRLKRTSFDGINHTLGMSKHDRKNKDDVVEVAPYVADMFQHHFSLEGKTRPRLYMYEQSDINSKMRAILVDWLVEVHMKFRLVPETLFLCINIIDRYCSQVKVRRSKLQLVGVTALLIACKYEEIYPPEVRDCVYITDSAYEREEVLDMEQDIVHKLGFRITVPTAYPFLQRFLKLLQASPLVRHASSYYTERTLQEHDMLCYRPSLICAAAIVLAVNNPDIPDGIKEDDDVHVSQSSFDTVHVPAILLEYTGFTKLEIYECAAKIAKKVAEETITASKRQLVAVKKKYDNKKYSNVSTEIALPEMSSQHFSSMD